MAVDQYMTDILKTLNMGATINISTYVEGKDLSRRSVDNFLNSIKNNFLLTSLKNYRGNWKIRAGFLTVLGFNAEEVVVLNHLYERSKMLKIEIIFMIIMQILNTKLPITIDKKHNLKVTRKKKPYQQA